MPAVRDRRSVRRSLELPIRVSGLDFQGRDFVEDATTLVVGRHGAKIRLTHQLILEDEIRILCQGNGREAAFRVVEKLGEGPNESSFWGVECLKPSENVWEGAPANPVAKLDRRPAPRLASKPGTQEKPSSREKSLVQVTLRCSQCGMRELVDLDAIQIEAVRKMKGLVRSCPACGTTGLWKRAAR